MTDIGDNSRAARDELMSFVERIERLTDERAIKAKEIAEEIKQVKAEAKGRGYDKGALNEMIRLRAMDPEKRALVGFYSDVLDIFA